MIKKKLLDICKNRVLKYIFFGGLTTFVNLLSYYLFRTLTNFSINAANIISIIIAILFAYIVNYRFVFESICNTRFERFSEFIKFISARVSTMIIEVLGVFLLFEILHFNDFTAKVIIQFIVLILNYIFSKLLVFNHKRPLILRLFIKYKDK